jgi:hypothetical protein
MAKIKAWLISVAGILSAIAVIFMSGKRKGKSELEAKQNDKILQDTKEIKKVENTIASMPDDKRERLREKYTID